MTDDVSGTLWITGAGGLIGHEITRLTPVLAPRFRVVAWTRAALDLTDIVAVAEAFRRQPPDLILHAAAVSKPAACAADPALARSVNIGATRHLRDFAGDAPVWLLSTDLVFDGLQGGYVETDPVNPPTFYGETKAEAERVLLENPRNAVFRLSLNGGRSPTGDRGFNEEFRRSLASGKPMTLFTDEFRCPAAASWTAGMLLGLAGRNDVTGIHHLCGGAKLSRFEIGRLLLRCWGMDETLLRPGSLREYSGPPRSPDTSLDCSKLEALVGRPFPGLGQWLEANPQEPF